MPEKLSTDERIKVIEKRMTRRQFARFTALGGIAAMISTKAYSEIPLDRLTDSNADEYVGTGCAFVLKNIHPDTTVAQIVYDPIQLRVESFRDRFDPIAEKDEYTLLKTLAIKIKATNKNITYADLCVHGEATAPTGVDTAAWKAVYDACSDETNGKKVSDLVSTPFLYLGDNDSKNAREKTIRPLLTYTAGNADPVFKMKVGHYKYRDLFTTAYEHLFIKSDGSFDGDAYNLIRTAFSVGVFKIVPPASLFENNHCYSSLEGDCISPSQFDYCALDNGQPTSSSDICP